MDFVMIEIFYLLCFSLSLQGAFGIITDPTPLNQVVLDGTLNVNITCVCTGDPAKIKWSLLPVGSTEEKIIKNGDRITDTDFVGRLGADGQSYILFIKTASSSTAGTYTCDEDGIYSVQLMVLATELSCDYSPREAKPPQSCDLPFLVSCTASYFAIKHLDYFVMKWSVEPESELDSRVAGQDVKTTISGNITTDVSTYNARWPLTVEDIKIFKCEAMFAMTGSVEGTLFTEAPVNIPPCRPFTSPFDVPCIDNDGILRPYTTLSHDDPGTAALTTTTSSVPVPGSNDNPKDDPKKSGDFSSSPRSAETNNLAILVLGVAGVLLLAQMF